MSTLWKVKTVKHANQSSEGQESLLTALAHKGGREEKTF